VGLIAVASAKGSPGVTTTALLFGALWPRQSLVAECDPAGGDVAWRMPAAHGHALDPQLGIVSLVAAGRKSMHPGLLPQHTQIVVGGLPVVVGVTAAEQSTGLAWDDLATLFARAPGVDVIADLGRIGARTPQNTLLRSAAVVVMVVDTVPSNVVHLRERIGRIHESLGGPMAAPIHVVVTAPPKRARAVREVHETLERSGVHVEAVHHLAYDVSGAGFFLGQVRGKPDRTALVRSAHPIVAALAQRTVSSFIGNQQTDDQNPEVSA